MADEQNDTQGTEPIETNGAAETVRPEELDTAGKSLSDALRISFAILKLIMIALIVGFLASGFRTVDSGERALVLRFGKIRGLGEQERVLGPGAHWIIPYPVDEMIRIPVESQITLDINSFWYKEDREDVLGEGPKPRRYFSEKLNPLEHGYNLTRSQRQTEQLFGRGGPTTDEAAGLDLAESTEGSDYNIVHDRWRIIYRVADVEDFYTNVLVRDVLPGQVYFDVMKAEVTPLLRSLFEDAVVDAMVRYTIDEALLSVDTIRRHVHRVVQQKLDDVDSGILVTSVQLVEVTWPKQVDEAFQEFVKASQMSSQAVSDAESYAQKTLNEAAGGVARLLYEKLQEADASEAELETLWSQVAGQAQDEIAQAQAYRTKVVASAEANANYLLSLLPEYEKRPEIVAQRIYMDTVERVLATAEKFIVDTGGQTKDSEIRVLVNRDPTRRQSGQQEQGN
jgi:regulator of protease activity HflC (stomatin/prohibitin superfamily)